MIDWLLDNYEYDIKKYIIYIHIISINPTTESL